ncbi:MAG: hypothetical protein ACOYMZ_02455 [Minisyncoccia bacterium]
MANGTPSKGFWRFIIISTLVSLMVLLLIAVIVQWRQKKTNTGELKALQIETKSLKKKVQTLEKGNAEEEKKTDEALAEVDRLKEYQVTLLDSIQKLQPKPDDKPDPKKDEKKVATTGTGRRKPGNSSNCNCPPVTRANTQTAWAKYGIPTP